MYGDARRGFVIAPCAVADGDHPVVIGLGSTQSGRGFCPLSIDDLYFALTGLTGKIDPNRQRPVEFRIHIKPYVGRANGAVAHQRNHLNPAWAVPQFLPGDLGVEIAGLRQPVQVRAHAEIAKVPDTHPVLKLFHQFRAVYIAKNIDPALRAARDTEFLPVAIPKIYVEL